jgi:hypothetical protein
MFIKSPVVYLIVSWHLLLILKILECMHVYAVVMAL